VSKLLEIALGIVTRIGGFLEAGSLATAPQAGAKFGYQLPRGLGLGRKPRTRRVPLAWLALSEPEHPRLRQEVA
jgi:hypothetical protein